MTYLTLNGCLIEHPTERERENGARSFAYLSMFTTAGHERRVNLTKIELIRLIEQASNHLYTIEKARDD